METVLYRHFDREGRLLYVGISLDVLRRTQQHRQTAPWFRDVANFTAERFPTRDAAIAAERRAIADERPAFNKQRPKAAPPKEAPPVLRAVEPAPPPRAIAFPGLPQWRGERAETAAGFRVLRLTQIAGPADLLAAEVPLPPWLPPEAWAMWCEHRRAKRRGSWTAPVARSCVKRLSDLREHPRHLDRTGAIPKVKIIEQRLIEAFDAAKNFKRQHLEAVTRVATFLGRSRQGRLLSDRAIDLGTALEVLLMSGSGGNGNTEISNKLKTRDVLPAVPARDKLDPSRSRGRCDGAGSLKGRFSGS